MTPVKGDSEESVFCYSVQEAVKQMVVLLWFFFLGRDIFEKTISFNLEKKFERQGSRLVF